MRKSGEREKGEGREKACLVLLPVSSVLGLVEVHHLSISLLKVVGELADVLVPANHQRALAMPLGVPPLTLVKIAVCAGEGAKPVDLVVLKEALHHVLVRMNDLALPVLDSHPPLALVG